MNFQIYTFFSSNPASRAVTIEDPALLESGFKGTEATKGVLTSETKKSQTNHRFVNSAVSGNSPDPILRRYARAESG